MYSQPVILPRSIPDFAVFCEDAVGGSTRKRFTFYADGPQQGYGPAIVDANDQVCVRINTISFVNAPIEGVSITGHLSTDPNQHLEGWIEWLTGRGRLGWSKRVPPDFSQLDQNLGIKWETSNAGNWLIGEAMTVTFAKQEPITLQLSKIQIVGKSPAEILQEEIGKDRLVQIKPYVLNMVNQPVGRCLVMGETETSRLEVAIDPQLNLLWVI